MCNFYFIEYHKYSSYIVVFSSILLQIREDKIDFYKLLDCTPETVTDADIETLSHYEEKGSYPLCVKLSFSRLQSPTYDCEAQIILSSQDRSISIPIELKG